MREDELLEITRDDLAIKPWLVLKSNITISTVYTEKKWNIGQV
jgi:hypothetical protein